MEIWDYEPKNDDALFAHLSQAGEVDGETLAETEVKIDLAIMRGKVGAIVGDKSTGYEPKNDKALIGFLSVTDNNGDTGTDNNWG